MRFLTSNFLSLTSYFKLLTFRLDVCMCSIVLHTIGRVRDRAYMHTGMSAFSSRSSVHSSVQLFIFSI